jgi:hypothetical protein
MSMSLALVCDGGVLEVGDVDQTGPVCGWQVSEGLVHRAGLVAYWSGCIRLGVPLHPMIGPRGVDASDCRIAVGACFLDIYDTARPVLHCWTKSESANQRWCVSAPGRRVTIESRAVAGLFLSATGDALTLSTTPYVWEFADVWLRDLIVGAVPVRGVPVAARPILWADPFLRFGHTFLERKHGALTARTGAGSPWRRARFVVVRDFSGTRRAFVENGSIGGGIVLFCDCFAVKSSGPVWPCLLMTLGSWSFAHETAHRGAFGADHMPVTVAELRADVGASVLAPDDKWVLVWKFPWDLRIMPGYVVIRNTPLPVGTYQLVDDGWWNPPDRWSFDALPIRAHVTKYRIDRANGEVHYMQRADARVAMITSSLFIKGFWGEDADEKERVVAMLRSLYAWGIYAFSCYSQHHAIVLYADTRTGALLTPTRMARVLAEPTVLGILSEHALAENRPAVRAWRDAYVDCFSV